MKRDEKHINSYYWIWKKPVWKYYVLNNILKVLFIYTNHILSSFQFSYSITSDYLRPHGLQHPNLPCPSPTPRVNSNSCPFSQWCHAATHPLSSPLPPAFNLSQHQGLFKWVGSSHQVAKILEFQIQHQSFQWTPRTDLL